MLEQSTNYNPKFFQEMIMILKNFWMKQGCAIIEGYDYPVGAGTLAPYTALKMLDSKPWNICQVQYCRRPTDGRFGNNPNRASAYYQMQVILKPAPANIQKLCIDSLENIGISRKEHDIKFMEDDWSNPSIGASGLGYELWCDGMEITQFTYMQKIGGIDIDARFVPSEITYGLERLAMYIQDKDNYLELDYCKTADEHGHEHIIKYKDINARAIEAEECHYYQNYQEDTKFLKTLFLHSIDNAKELITKNMKNIAYEQCLIASHTLNILDARHELSQNERTNWILAIREIVSQIIQQ